VPLAGGKDEADFREGGVRARVGSWIVVECPEIGSGETVSGATWGIVSPKNSLRRTREYVWFASSADLEISILINMINVTR
jgi:hypothetical protein